MNSTIKFDQPVRRQFVHRASTTEVLPTDFHHIGVDSFVAGLQWPRGHGFYRLEPLDSALVVESIRQLTILTAHLGYDVSLGVRFVMTGLGFRMWNQPCLEPGQAVEITADVSSTNIRRAHSGALRSLRVQVELMHNGATIASGYGDALLLTLAQYARIRGRHYDVHPLPVVRRPAGPSPSRIGRFSEHDVTVRETPQGLEAVADPSNPILFDHLVDHVPGAALIEACLQAVRLRTGAAASIDFASFDAVFHRMVEFDAPNTLELSIADGCRIMISQDGHPCVEAVGRLRGS